MLVIFIYILWYCYS